MAEYQPEDFADSRTDRDTSTTGGDLRSRSMASTEIRRSVV